MAASDDDALAEAYNRALDLEKAGRLDAAADAYREVLSIDPADHGGAAVRLAAIGRGATPDKAPDAYVATLFDQNAEAFDDILVEQLGYSVPMLVREKLQALAPGPYARALDLGCGTGLSGASVADMSAHLTGVDLSENMIEIAAERDVYHDLYVGEAVDFLTSVDEPPWDLITATDVLPYVGALEALMNGFASRLNPEGVLAFSAETRPDDGTPYQVGRKCRFAHARPYLEEMLAARRLTSIVFDPITVRSEDGAPVPGYLVIARAPG